MGEAFAAALLLGALNTLGDLAAAELKLQAVPAYVVARSLLVCKVAGALVGARARQTLIGWLGGLAIGAAVGIAYHLLVPALGWMAEAVAWVLFWLGFAFLVAMLEGGTAMGALLQGTIAAALAASAYYLIAGVWPEPSPRDPSYLRVFVVWTTAFLPGFIALFWRRT